MQRNAREDVCATKEMDATFAENRVNNIAGSNTLKNQYLGTAQGVFREFDVRHFNITSVESCIWLQCSLAHTLPYHRELPWACLVV